MLVNSYSLFIALSALHYLLWIKILSSFVSCDRLPKIAKVK
ncbi:hypothetical protein NEOC65_002189 [Neochlamydia sp. AcF65]|nr:hypothetical protein [Neochlamydia sp. AcF65]MBS4170771.1 hypothetical protein [Neochlamydia sp. AcF95]